MVDFLKGNYQLPEKRDTASKPRNPEKNLTERFEEAALAKLGGSICFVVKGKTLLWSGESSEKTS